MMEHPTHLRSLRLRYGIFLSDLAKTMGVSNQCISRMELLQTPATKERQVRCAQAMEAVIAARYRAVRELERDYRAVKNNLLAEEEDDAGE